MDDLPVYLDYNATTPLEDEVLNVIRTALKDAWGNPSSAHHAGVKAKDVLQVSRKSVADMVNAKPSDIIFTSGGTEANNQILNTALQYFIEGFTSNKLQGSLNGDGMRKSLPHFITSNLEHDSIKLVLEAFVHQGKADVTYVPACKTTGRVEVRDVIAEIRQTTCMISIMLANNETGIIQPIGDIMRKVREHSPRILLHTDAAQAIGKITVDVEELGVDYLTIVGHKFYGPRIGALYCRNLGTKIPLYPMLYGGGQERNYRPGTENVGMIAGLGKAAQMVVDNLEQYSHHMESIRDYLELKLEETFPGNVHYNGRLEGSQRIPNTANVSIIGPQFIGNKVLSLMKQTQASVGAACHSHTECRASPILLASGVPEEYAINALRMSVGRHTTMAEIDTVISDLKQAVDTLSPCSS